MVEATMGSPSGLTLPECSGSLFLKVRVMVAIPVFKLFQCHSEPAGGLPSIRAPLRHQPSRRSTPQRMPDHVLAKPGVFQDAFPS